MSYLDKTSVRAQIVADQFSHHVSHSNELLKKYPDLEIVAEGSVVQYYSVKIASEVDKFDFVEETPHTYITLHVLHPYKNVQITCTKCDGSIRVNSSPYRIPIFMENELKFHSEYSIYSFVYDDLIKRHNFSAKTLVETQLYILAKLEEHSKKSHKLDLSAMSSSIKTLLTFS